MTTVKNSTSANTRTSRVCFTVAKKADDAEIRRLLRENPMGGRIRLTLEREPDFFADADWPGTEKQTIVAREAGRVICTGSCTVRERFVNGTPRRVGYLGGLRLDARARGRFDVLRRGYEFFNEHQSDAPADFYFTSIAADNLAARKFLERGLRGMPAYEFIGEFVTLILPAERRSPTRRAPVPTGAETGALNANAILAFINDHNRRHQFAPCWASPELSALSTLGLHAEDFCVVREAGRITACAALWDQRAFKQTVIRGFAPWLTIARPALNLAARFCNTPRLPAAGSTLAHAFVSHLAVTDDNDAALLQLIGQLRARAAQQAVEFLTLGFAANHPHLEIILQTFPCREYRSRIYIVRWPGLGGAARELDERPLAPEVALL